MKYLIVGASGMLGTTLLNTLEGMNYPVVGLDLSESQYEVDLSDDKQVFGALSEIKPDVIVNCAAIVDLTLCESNRLLAWNVNARAASLLAGYAAKVQSKLVQISTDHYFTGDGDQLHDERAPVIFLNEYARTKYCGEELALVAPDSLVLRTNIVGFRPDGKSTFAQWAFDSVQEDAEMTLFEDAFASCIDVRSFSRAIVDLVEKGASGLLNVANHEVFSKKQFVEAVADACGKQLTRAKTGTVKSLGVVRADSCGLDVSRAEEILGYELPNLKEVVANLATMQSDLSN